MRHAPPVSVQCRGRGWRLLQAGLAALCAAVLAACAAQHLLGVADGWAAATAGACAATCAGALAWRALRQPATLLRWDGQVWSADGHAVQLQLMLDLGGALLLRWQLPAGGRWCWTAVSPSDAGAAWHALRTALHAHATGAHPEGTAWR